jgi:hypothetical protein
LLIAKPLEKFAKSSPEKLYTNEAKWINASKWLGKEKSFTNVS